MNMLKRKNTLSPNDSKYSTVKKLLVFIIVFGILLLIFISFCSNLLASDKKAISNCRNHFEEMLYAHDYSSAQGSIGLLWYEPKIGFLTKKDFFETRAYAMSVFLEYQHSVYQKYLSGEISKLKLRQEGEAMSLHGLFDSYEYFQQRLTKEGYPVPAVSPVPVEMYPTLIDGDWNTTRRSVPNTSETGVTRAGIPIEETYQIQNGEFISYNTISYEIDGPYISLTDSDGMGLIEPDGTELGKAVLYFRSWDNFYISSLEDWEQQVEENDYHSTYVSWCCSRVKAH